VSGRGGLLIPFLATAAAHGAWSVSRLASVPDEPIHVMLLLVPLVLWGLGVYARSLVVLLVFVPVTWAGSAYLPDVPPFSPGGGLAAVWTLLVYAATTLAWSSGHAGTPSTPIQWTPVAPVGVGSATTAAGRDGWLVAALTVGPALGFLLTPGIDARLTRSFGPLGGLAAAGLCVLGTLLGLALATDVWRARPPRAPSRRRAVRHAVALGVAGAAAAFVR